MSSLPWPRSPPPSSATPSSPRSLAAGASDDFQPLIPGAYGFFTVVGVLAGLIGWLLVRRTANATDTLRWLVPTVLVLSLIPDVLVGLSDRVGVSWGAVAALMVMHVVVTIAAVTSFHRFLPTDGPTTPSSQTRLQARDHPSGLYSIKAVPRRSRGRQFAEFDLLKVISVESRCCGGRSVQG